MDGVIRFDPVGTIEGFEESEFGKYVFASDFDAALTRHVSDLKLRDRELEIAAEHHSELQEQLAALREELKARELDVKAHAGRRVAAEQRNVDQLKLISGLVEYADNLLGDVNNAWSYAGNTGKPEVHKDGDYAAAVALIAKPTESGASE